ncbi:MAG: HlyD family efflux transporter periplasmic adaptor subunit [Planctomycetota bacterium]
MTQNGDNPVNPTEDSALSGGSGAAPQTEDDDVVMNVDATKSEEAPSLTNKIFKLSLAVVIVLSSVLVARYWIKNPPVQQRQRPQKFVTLVETVIVEPSARRAVISAMGTVKPSRTYRVSSRVSGEIVYVSPDLRPGSRIAKDAVLIRIDPTDYAFAQKDAENAIRQIQADIKQQRETVTQRENDIRLAAISVERAKIAIRSREADVIKAASALEQERGQQASAQSDFDLLNDAADESNRALILREPQLKIALANLDAANASLDLAKRDVETALASKENAEILKRSAEAVLEAKTVSLATAETSLEKTNEQLKRTNILAPADCVVTGASAEVGDIAAVNATLATLADAGRYWIELAVDLPSLRYIDIPDHNATTGSKVNILPGPTLFSARDGVIERLAPDLEPLGRMTRLIAAVNDPLDLKTAPDKRSPLLLGAYLQVNINGAELNDAIYIPRTALRDGRSVWLMTPDRTLAVRPVEILYAETNGVFVRGGLSAGDSLIVSPLSAPVEGMALRTTADGTENGNSKPAAPDATPSTGGRP